jgi:hypothetical protein
VTNTSVATKVHQSLDAHTHFPAQISLNAITSDCIAYGVQLLLRQLVNFCRLRNPSALTNLAGCSATYPIDIRKGNDSMFVVWDVDSSYTSHSLLSEITLCQDDKNMPLHFTSEAGRQGAAG